MPLVKQHRENNIMTWTLDDPKTMNAIGTTMAKELRQALTDLENTPKTEKPLILVIQANTQIRKNSPIWIAGGNLKELKKLSSPDEYISTMTEVCLGLRKLPLIVIAAIHGDAIGGGAELAIHTDIRVMSKESHFIFSQLKVGLCLGYGSSSRLVELIGETQSFNILFNTQVTNAEQAYNIGLASQVLDKNEWPHYLNSLDHKLSKFDHQAIDVQKKLLTTKTTNTDAQTLFSGLWKNPTHQSTLERY